MELVGKLSSPQSNLLLEVPGFSPLDLDEDDGQVFIGIRPKSSPLPRRRSSSTEEDLDFEPPPTGSRRVSFADSKGLSLVQVKEFGSWDVPGCAPCAGDRGDAEEFFISPLTFSVPRPPGDLLARVWEQKVELETLEILPGTAILRGVIRVLNISFDKAVYIRTSLDSWSSHFDLLAEFVPGSSDGTTDRFSFQLPLVPPYGTQGAQVDFCLRYETPAGTFWANNDHRNYVLLCQRLAKGRKDRPPHRRSCLKPPSSPVEPTGVESSTGERSTVDSPPASTVSARGSSEPSEPSEERERKEQMEIKPSSRSKRRRRRTPQLVQTNGEQIEESRPDVPSGCSPSVSEAPGTQGPAPVCVWSSDGELEILQRAPPPTSGVDPEPSDGGERMSSAAVNGCQNPCREEGDGKRATEHQSPNKSPEGEEPKSSQRGAEEHAGPAGGEDIGPGGRTDKASQNSAKMENPEPTLEAWTGPQHPVPTSPHNHPPTPVSKQSPHLQRGAGADDQTSNLQHEATVRRLKDEAKEEEEWTTGGGDHQEEAEEFLSDSGPQEEPLVFSLTKTSRREPENPVDVCVEPLREDRELSTHLTSLVHHHPTETLNQPSALHTPEATYSTEEDNTRVRRTHEDSEVGGAYSSLLPKNWEMMVEEEEVNILMNDQEGETVELRREEVLEDTERTGEQVQEVNMEDTVKVSNSARTNSEPAEEPEAGDRREEDRRKRERGEEEEARDPERTETGSSQDQVVSRTLEPNSCMEAEDEGGEKRLHDDDGDGDEDDSSVLDHELLPSGRECNEEDTQGESDEEVQSCTHAGADRPLDKETWDAGESARTDVESSSAESDSDDEVELYMHCLRAVSVASDTGFTPRRSSVKWSKGQATPMPSISEEPHPLSPREEPHPPNPKEEPEWEWAETRSSGTHTQNCGWRSWCSGDSLSCSSVSKALGCTSLLVVFCVVASHYDFLACFGLYVVSVVWLCCQEEKHNTKEHKPIG